MIYEIKLNQRKIKRDYVKVPFGKRQYVVGRRLIKVPKQLFNKLYVEQPDNFLFFIDGVQEVKKKEISDLTALAGTIEERKKTRRKKKIFKRSKDKNKSE